ncbi:MAG: betaine--homocysteine S-methyltransferase [Anaerolineales bacterium]|nr:betaine--homocysteine S-methyltransferase [Anaerolineales bacterium]
MDKLRNLLQAGKPILLDGAMGTMLMDAGLESGNSPEEWNVHYPEKIRQIHRAYIEAGSQIILTNTFGGTSVRMETHGLQDRVIELNKKAAENACAEADAAPHTVLVAGSMGPTGQLLEPLGTLSASDAEKSFADQAAGLAQGGVDLFWIETMSDLSEVKAAVAGIRSVSDLPIAATMSFDSHGRTMMGVSPEKAVKELEELDIQLMGANCGTGSDELIKAIKEMQSADPKLPLIAKANAGIPQMVGTEVVYDGSPELMAAYAAEVWKEGASLIGGCCGSSPAHIRAMAEALKSLSR